VELLEYGAAPREVAAKSLISLRSCLRHQGTRNETLPPEDPKQVSKFESKTQVRNYRYSTAGFTIFLCISPDWNRFHDMGTGP
jgi:hypothetical protein